MTTRRIYDSSNGDTWDLLNSGDRLVVRHAPNASSGGTPTDYELEAFLGRERQTPQGEALVQMIGTLLADDSD